MKRTLALLAALAMTVVVGAQDAPIVDFAQANTYKVENNIPAHSITHLPGEGGGLQVTQAAGDNAVAFFSIHRKGYGTALPDFVKAELVADLTVAAMAGNCTVSCRVTDKDGEVFQFVMGHLKAGQLGRQQLRLVVDTAAIKASVWGGKVKNRKLDFPVRLVGFALNFSTSSPAAKVVFHSLTQRSLDGKAVQVKCQRLIGLDEPGVTRLFFQKAKGQGGAMADMNGKKGLELEFNCAEAEYMELDVWRTGDGNFPKVGKCRIVQEVFVPEAEVHKASTVSIRLIDATGEVFQYGRGCSNLAPGWNKLVFVIDPAAIHGASWGGSAPNHRLDFPVRFKGYAVNFKERSGMGVLGLADPVVEWEE